MNLHSAGLWVVLEQGWVPKLGGCAGQVPLPLLTWRTPASVSPGPAGGLVGQGEPSRAPHPSLWFWLGLNSPPRQPAVTPTGGAIRAEGL